MCRLLLNRSNETKRLVKTASSNNVNVTTAQAYHILRYLYAVFTLKHFSLQLQNVLKSANLGV